MGIATSSISGIGADTSKMALGTLLGQEPQGSTTRVLELAVRPVGSKW
jgi:hypothetical protein